MQKLPDDVIPLLCRNRRTLLAIRCTCRRFTECISTKPWKILVSVDLFNGRTRNFIMPVPEIHLETLICPLNWESITRVTVISGGVCVYSCNPYKKTARVALVHAPAYAVARECVLCGLSTPLPWDVVETSEELVPSSARTIGTVFTHIMDILPTADVIPRSLTGLEFVNAVMHNKYRRVVLVAPPIDIIAYANTM
jgi:hypothetical protein